MFEILFKYPAAVFSKGKFTLLSSWPLWLLGALIAAASITLWWALRRRRPDTAAAWTRARSLMLWAFQSALVAVLLLLLWQPAISVATLKPQQNVVAVVMDGSRSMQIVEEGATRRDRVVRVLEAGLRGELEKQFQVRYFMLGGDAVRLEKPEEVSATSPATRIGDGLKQVASLAGSLPLGAVVLLSDGADNAGGIDHATISEIRRRRIPVHTVGFGREQYARDVEVTDAVVPQRALADSRLAAQVSFRQRGYARQKARVHLREAGKVLASREFTFAADGVLQTETVMFQSGLAGARNLEIAVDLQSGEENPKNNAILRLVHVEAAKPRILYLEGEPRWEFKFIRRAIEEDRSLELVSLLRTTQNKIYRQGIGNQQELEAGFPSKVEELFGFKGLVIGSVEAAYFTSSQQELIRQFVDRRGGGLLFLAGRASFAEGGYATTPLADLLPVSLPPRKTTFVRDTANAELTAAGRDNLVCRLEEEPDRNAERWKKLPYLANFQDIGAPKPGAVTLAEFSPGGRGRFPLLVTEQYGRGRTAALATAGTWRWQMQQPLADRSHEMFWGQLMRWLVAGTPGQVVASTPQQVLADDGRVELRAEVRDRNYLPSPDASVEARITGPEGIAVTVELAPDPLTPGSYAAAWNAGKPGGYLAEVLARRGEEEIGHDVLMFRREDGVAENFRAEQNRELLEKLASETGGRYWRPEEARKLSKEISFSEAGITTRETKDLWNMPVVFLLLFGIRAAEWLLRRKWGAV